MPISNKFHHFEGDGSVSSRLHFWRRLLWSAQTSEYDSRACWESFTPLLVMPLPALIRSFLHMLFFSASLERFWSLYCSNSVEDETKDDTSTKSRAAVINTVLRSDNLKAAVLPVLRPGVNVSKSTSLHFPFSEADVTWHGSSYQLVCVRMGNERPMWSTLSTMKMLESTFHCYHLI